MLPLGCFPLFRQIGGSFMAAVENKHTMGKNGKKIEFSQKIINFRNYDGG